MIIIGMQSIHPIYARIHVTRMEIYAEICVYRRSLHQIPACGDRILILEPYPAYVCVDALITQRENVIIRAYDPLTYHLRYRIATPPQGGVEWKYTDKKAPSAVYTILQNHTESTTLAKLGAIINPLDDDYKDVGPVVPVALRFDTLYPVYASIFAISPQTRIRIGKNGSNTEYTIEYAPDTDIHHISGGYTYDYVYNQSIPTTCVVAGVGIGAERPYVRTDDTADIRREMFAMSRYSAPALLMLDGRNALSAAKSKNTNITLRLLAAHTPEGMYPGSTMIMGDTSYIVYAIEYTTSPRGAIAYISAGGRVMSVAERIDAIIAADYAAKI